MALTKDEKNQVVADVSELLAHSKLTVIAEYQGTGVKQMQELRRSARETGTVVKVVKNRLVRQALLATDSLKKADTSVLTGQLLYAFNADDEVAPAQALANFARKNPTIEFVGAITPDGQLMAVEDVKSLAALPSKDQLRAQLVGMLGAPLSGFVNVLSGNIRGVLNVMSARAEAIK
jgi:large subunit ribosomal protein L10